MKISILGSKGIPANYGGFETLAEYLSIYLVNEGHDVTVFCSGFKKRSKYKGVNLQYIPLKPNNFQGVFYDFFCLLISSFTCDKIIMLGSPAGPLFNFIPGLKKKVIFNYGGLDFKRNKWSPIVQKFIAYGKKNAIKFSKKVVADNQGIYDYIIRNYEIDKNKLHLIAYGGNHSENKDNIRNINLIKVPNDYSLTIARIQKDNNIEIIIKAALKYKFNSIIIGNWNFSRYGRKLKSKYVNHKNLFLLDPIYDLKTLFFYRTNCRYYIHGHSAGGTNPTLVESMWLGLNIFAYDNVFNKNTTEFKCNYWRSADELGTLINKSKLKLITNNSKTMKEIAYRRYNWKFICKKYMKLIEDE